MTSAKSAGKASSRSGAPSYSVRLNSEEITRWLEKKSMTAHALAQMLEVTDGALSRYLSGSRIPSLEMVAKIGRVTKIRFGRLISMSITEKTLMQVLDELKKKEKQ